jgi:hypothetical protein
MTKFKCSNCTDQDGVSGKCECNINEIRCGPPDKCIYDEKFKPFWVKKVVSNSTKQFVKYNKKVVK